MTETAVIGSHGAFRWLEALESRPFGSLWLGLGVAALLSIGMLLWWAALGLWLTLFDPTQPLGLSFDARQHLTVGVLIAFVVAGSRHAQRRTLEELAELRPRTRLSGAELAELTAGYYALPARVLAAAAAAGFLIATALIPLTSANPGILLDPDWWNAHSFWAIACNSWMFTLALIAAARTVSGRRLFESVAGAIADDDLFDREVVAPFAHFGLRGAFIWIGSSSIGSSLAWGMADTAPLWVILAGTLALATVSFVRPARVIRARLRTAKRAELGRVRARIAAAKEAALARDAARSGPEAALLPGLVAYEARIAALHEWPFDTPTVARFSALALLAAGSWLGGALVERLLGTFLD